MTSPATAPFNNGNASLPFRQLKGLFLRYVYLLRGSWPRLIEIFFWPTLEVVIWGFFNSYIVQQNGGNARYLAYFLPAVILWNVLMRTSLAMLTLFLEEVWSRNLGHLFASPLKPTTYIAGLMIFSVMRMMLAMSACVLVAYLVFKLSIFDLMPDLLLFVMSLIMSGWVIGLVLASLLLRYGLAVEWLAWFITFLLLPFSAVYYPVSILPSFLQPLAWLLPPTYVFESMRAVMQGAAFPWLMMFKSFLLNAGYLAIALFIMRRAYVTARAEGRLLQSGE